MLKGIVITNDFNGLKEKFCSSNILKRKVNKEGEYSIFVIPICVGVIKVAKDRKKISE